MNTSRSDENDRPDASLGERIVGLARILSAEHIKQELADAGVDMAAIQRELRKRVVRQDLFSTPNESPFASDAPIALPQRVKAVRKPPKGAGDLGISEAA